MFVYDSENDTDDKIQIVELPNEEFVSLPERGSKPLNSVPYRQSTFAARVVPAGRLL